MQNDDLPCLILVGGVPGSGKTFLGKVLARELGVHLDKDAISRMFTENLLVALNQSPHDREGDIYRRRVRDLEYESMMKQAYETLEAGHTTICSAPFSFELRSHAWIDHVAYRCRLLNVPLHKVWVYADPDTTRHRLHCRGADRDTYKLAHWEEYVRQTQHGAPESVGYFTVIDNTDDAPVSLRDQVYDFVYLVRGGKVCHRIGHI